jgi:hypothetical protein
MKKYIVVIMLIFTVTLSGCDILNPPEDTPEVIFALHDGQDTVEINTEWIDAGAVLSVDTLSHDVTTDEIVDTTVIGLYMVEYTYEYLEISYSLTRYVNVVDQINPVITLNLGIDTITLDNTWTDAGATVIDNSGEVLTLTVSGTVDTTTTGTYEIIYSATDSSGNVASIVRYINVIE